MAKLQIKSEKPLLLEDFFSGRGAILTPHGLSVIILQSYTIIFDFGKPPSHLLKRK